MNSNRLLTHESSRSVQRGAAAVEFAIVSLVFFTMLFGAIEVGRLMFLWNTAAEVTRLGARMAVVCSPTSTSRDAIRARMRQLLPHIAATDITVAYTTAALGACDDLTPATTCQLATVSLTPTTPIKTFIPLGTLSVVMPPFSTTLYRESMQSTFGGVANPACS